MGEKGQDSRNGRTGDKSHAGQNGELSLADQADELKTDQLARMRELVRHYLVTDGSSFRLADQDPTDTAGLGDDGKKEAKTLLRAGAAWLAKEQEMLYAQDDWALLVIFQAMDAAGKDSTIDHVMSGVNPQGCQVFSFKHPSAEELDHDYMWRYLQRLPERGRIGIFNRSYYEDVLVVRVHEPLLRAQKLPRALVGEGIWRDRHEDIAAIERHLGRNGTAILKVFLNISPAEQKRRLLQRLERPDKHWKWDSRDLVERGFWADYMRAYEDAIRATATPQAPWLVVPADHKWFARLVVAASIVDRLASMGLAYPVVDDAKRADIEKALKALSADGG